MGMRWWLIGLVMGSCSVGFASLAGAIEGPANLELQLRTREQVSDNQPAVVSFTPAQWAPEQTAVIVCDMWDAHHCLNAVRREQEMAPRMNHFLQAMRERGSLIIHAPSSCMAAYEDHPGRELARSAPTASNLPETIGDWCYVATDEPGDRYPLDQSDGGEDDDPQEHAQWHAQLTAQGRNPNAPWLRQTDLLTIAQGDAISDSGVEIWNLLEHRGINQVLLVGVHTNMCVLGRPFGLRQLSQHGKNVVLVRDLTDTMYNPQRWPYVSHFAGTDRIIEYIETYICPTISSDQVLGGQPFRFRQDQRPHLVCVLAEDEYQTEVTVPRLLNRLLPSTFRLSYVLQDPEDPQALSGWELIDQADLLLISVRRKALPQEQLQALRSKIKQGVPVIGLRTASHAFALRDDQTPSGRAQWPEFDADVLGGNYHLHHGNKGPGDPATWIWATPEARQGPWSSVLPDEAIRVTSWLYKTEPLRPGTDILLMGRVADRQPHEPVAWTYVNRYGGRVFYTSLGHPDDFETPFFVPLLRQALLWASGLDHDQEVPSGEIPSQPLGPRQ